MIFKKMNIVYRSKTCIYLVYICDEICGVSVYSTLEAEIIINDSDLDDALKLIFSI